MNKRFRLLLVAALALAAAALAQAPKQNGMQMKDMNDMSYAQIKAMMANPAMKAKAMKVAKANHVILMVGDPVQGKAVTWKGELTGANCYLGVGLHGHHHAMCAKACVNAGSPIVFLHDGKTYLVLTPQDGMPLPKAVYNDLGDPGVTVHGQVIDNHGIPAIAVHSASGK